VCVPSPCFAISYAQLAFTSAIASKKDGMNNVSPGGRRNREIESSAPIRSEEKSSAPIRSEEKLLRAAFESEFEAYKNHVPAMLPRMWPK